MSAYYTDGNAVYVTTQISTEALEMFREMGYIVLFLC